MRQFRIQVFITKPSGFRVWINSVQSTDPAQVIAHCAHFYSLDCYTWKAASIPEHGL